MTIAPSARLNSERSVMASVSRQDIKAREVVALDKRSTMFLRERMAVATPLSGALCALYSGTGVEVISPVSASIASTQVTVKCHYGVRRARKASRV
jgi:hypothetical protein